MPRPFNNAVILYLICSQPPTCSILDYQYHTFFSPSESCAMLPAKLWSAHDPNVVCSLPQIPMNFYSVMYHYSPQLYTLLDSEVLCLSVLTDSWKSWPQKSLSCIKVLPTGINNFQVHDSVEQFYKVPTPKLVHWTSRQRKETNLASALPFLFPVFCMRASFILLSCTSSLRGKPGVISTFPLDFIPSIRLCIENVVQRLTLSLPCGIE